MIRIRRPAFVTPFLRDGDRLHLDLWLVKIPGAHVLEDTLTEGRGL